jgi:diadenosine tetraphosphate (Ap4A) HIT family hydrolase
MEAGPQDVSSDDCFLCAANGRALDSLPWFDRPLIREAGVGVAVSAVGALVPGHILVSPIDHTRSVRELAPHRREAFLAFARQVRRHLENAYGPVTLFEHGSCRDTRQRRSACVTHTHIQLLPGRYRFDRLPLPVSSSDSLEGLLAAAAKLGNERGYLLHQEPGARVCLAADVGVSQYFRRHIAEVVGEPDDWDYALFPRWENIRATHRDLSGIQAEIGELRQGGLP